MKDKIKILRICLYVSLFAYALSCILTQTLITIDFGIVYTFAEGVPLGGTAVGDMKLHAKIIATVLVVLEAALAAQRKASYSKFAIVISVVRILPIIILFACAVIGCVTARCGDPYINVSFFVYIAPFLAIASIVLHTFIIREKKKIAWEEEYNLQSYEQQETTNTSEIQ